MPKQAAHPVPLVPPPSWMTDLINQVVDDLVQAKGGWVSLSSADIKDRLTAALRKKSQESAHKSANKSAAEPLQRRAIG